MCQQLEHNVSKLHKHNQEILEQFGSQRKLIKHKIL